MGRKRPSTEQGGSSAGQQPPPSSYDRKRFVSRTAQDRYEDVLLSKSVSKERGFQPYREFSELNDMIAEKHWHGFCEPPPPVPLGIVREFYANAMETQNGKSWVRGKRIDYGVLAIRAVYGFVEKPPGVEDWTFKARSEVDLDEIVTTLCIPATDWTRTPEGNIPITFPTKCMNRFARAWHMFITANLLPSTHSHTVTVERAILLWAILKGEFVDLGYLLHQNMLRFMRGGSTSAIPHGAVVARICQAAGVEWGIEEQVQQPAGLIDRSALLRLPEWAGGEPHQRGLGYIIRDSSAEESHHTPPIPGSQTATADDAGGQAPEPMRVDPDGLTSTEYRRLQRRVDASHELTRLHMEDVAQVMRRLIQYQGYEVDWPQFGVHFPYPPPDTPPDA